MRAVLFTLTLAACGLPPLDGPEPAFTVGEEFVAADLVFQELERGAAFYFLDARPTVDFELEHIAGAVSTPFYEIEDHARQLPRDIWYIAYCSCPHSESGIVAEHLRESGHERVAVLDEGFLYWVEQGYPTESGG